MSTRATASASETSTTPSVLTALGLGNSAPTVTPEEVGHVPASTPVESVDKSSVAVAPESKAEAPKESADKPEEKAADADTDKTQKELTRLNKQLKDTRDAYTRERQVNVETQRKIDTLTKQIEVLGKKFDGTYDEQKDAPKVMPPEVLVDEAKKSERVAASHWAAVEQYGEEYVMKTIWADDAPFRQFDADPAVQARVFSAKLPLLEAIKVVKEAEAKAKYGSDPDAMRKAIETEVRTNLEKEVREKVLKEMKSKGVALDTIKGLGGVASVTPGTPDEKPRLVFDSLFPGFSKTAG